MDKINQFNQARQAQESRFQRLPHEPASLVKSLITIADPYTGMVTGLTWHDISLFLEVEKRPGRKNSGIPSKEQTREYVNTILKQCGDDFKMATVGQNLQFQFTNMPAIYAQFFTEETQSRTVNPIDVLIATSLEDTGFIEDFDILFDREFPMEHPTLNTPVKNNNIYIINKHKQTNITGDVGCKSKDFKKPISQDFYPNEKTIREALGIGLSKVTDMTEIKKFILYNTEKNRRWEDFNPVFLNWLIREQKFSSVEFKQQPDFKNKNLRSCDNERSSNKNNSYERTMEQVLRDNPDAHTPSGDCSALNPFNLIEFVNSKHKLALDQVNENLRTNVYQ